MTESEQMCRDLRAKLPESLKTARFYVDISTQLDGESLRTYYCCIVNMDTATKSDDKLAHASCALSAEDAQLDVLLQLSLYLQKQAAGAEEVASWSR